MSYPIAFIDSDETFATICTATRIVWTALVILTVIVAPIWWWDSRKKVSKEYQDEVN